MGIVTMNPVDETGTQQELDLRGNLGVERDDDGGS